ncbi:unnamed protein product [Hermetia illucens]|uniref:Uncharacterized protein n=1 Tax=Hermetia illucens TaxID=343691 RepID=A0A7R8YYQ4_HERIL|nr:unnamed protein product [Hermetia illucens]
MRNQHRIQQTRSTWRKASIGLHRRTAPLHVMATPITTTTTAAASVPAAPTEFTVGSPSAGPCRRRSQVGRQFVFATSS